MEDYCCSVLGLSCLLHRAMIRFFVCTLYYVHFCREGNFFCFSAFELSFNFSLFVCEGGSIVKERLTQLNLWHLGF